MTILVTIDVMIYCLVAGYMVYTLIDPRPDSTTTMIMWEFLSIVISSSKHLTHIKMNQHGLSAALHPKEVALNAN